MKRNHSHFSSNQGKGLAAGSHGGSLRSVALASALACLSWSGLAVLPTAHAQSASSQNPVSGEEKPIRIADSAKQARPAIATRFDGNRSASLPA